jgi:hypothetical protein
MSNAGTSVMVQQSAISSKHCGKLQKDVILMHDNTCPHKANKMVKTTSELG